MLGFDFGRRHPVRFYGVFKTMGKIPSGFPHSDGSQHIHNVSHELSTAGKDLMRAHTRLNDFLSRGIVPEDLKRSG